MTAWWQGIKQRSRNLAAGITQRLGLSLALLVVIATGTLAQLAGAGVGLAPVASAHGRTSAGTPNHFDPRQTHEPSPAAGAGQAAPSHGTLVPPQPVVRGGQFSMQPDVIALVPGKAAHFVGSDGVLTVDVPAGAVTSADVAAAGGALNLEVSQVAFPAGSSAGGSGRVSFGMYLFQIVDAHGVLVAHGLRAPVTLHLYYGPHGSGGDLGEAYVAINDTLPRGTLVAPISAAQAPVGPSYYGHHTSMGGPAAGTVLTPSVPVTSIKPAALGMGPVGLAQTALDTTHHTLSATINLSGPTTSTSWNTDAPVATFGRPDPFSVDLNAGSVMGSYPLDVPAGPGGLTPPLNLTYSGTSVSEVHNIQAGAPWVGEGWNLDLGEVTWSEHNVPATCSAINNCTARWENSWQLIDPLGTSAELIPPDTNYSSYWDDSGSNPCNMGSKKGNPTHTCPVQWHTATEDNAQIWMYTNPDGNSAGWMMDSLGAIPPCWRVFEPNGIMEEFGCTEDSLEYYYTPGMGDYISAWKLDMIVDPQGNQIHIVYNQDVETDTVNGVNHTYIRDAVMKTVEWDSPSCRSQTLCTGAAWQPMVQVSFAASHTPTYTYGGNPCTGQNGLRCDDPWNYTGGLPAPEVQSDFVLNDADVQVCTGNCPSYPNETWSTLRDYQFSYDQSYYQSYTDQVTGEQEYVAGRLLLTKLQVLGDDGTTTLAPVIFQYQQIAEWYEDSSLVSPAPTGGNCGPSWNITPCYLWDENNQGNSWFLSGIANGMGGLTTYTWQLARDNTHGGYIDPTTHYHYDNDPFKCDGNEASAPCNVADDNAWSVAAVTQSSSTVVQSCSTCGTSDKVTGTTTYQYVLTTYQGGTELCSTCYASMYWGSQDDLDWADYYNAHFMGFTEADVTNPDQSLVKHYYFATDGWGVWNNTKVQCPLPGDGVPRSNNEPCKQAPWWGPGTALHGHEYEVDTFNVASGRQELSKTTTSYTLNCPAKDVTSITPPGPYGSWGNLVSSVDPENPVGVCDIYTGQTDTYTYDGISGSPPVPHSSTTYSFDMFGRLTDTTTTTNDGTVNGNVSSVHNHTDYVWDVNISTPPNAGGPTQGTYLVDFPAQEYTTQQGQTTQTACAQQRYDGQASWQDGSGDTSLTMGELTATTTFPNCASLSSSPITTTMTYDAYGNAQTTDDPDANSSPAVPGHTGCTIPNSGATYSTCQTYDGTFETLPTSSANALYPAFPATTVSYGDASSPGLGGFGLWPTSVTDANGQATTTTYDVFGRTATTNLPGESGAYTTQTTYLNWCPQPPANFPVTPEPQPPCVGVATTRRLDGNNTITSYAFYDGYGNLVETRTPAPTSGEDLITYAQYDYEGRLSYQSNPYEVQAYTGAPGSAAFSTPDSSKSGMKYTYPDLLTTTEQDPLSNTTTTTASVACGVVSGDSACYAQTAVVDPLNHQTASESDAWGRDIYDLTYTGKTAPYTLYATTANTYDANGALTQILHPDGTSKTTFAYDTAGRMTSSSDPDSGTWSYTQYDADGNLLRQSDARAGGTCPTGSVCGPVYASYDGLDRLTAESVHSDLSSPFATWSYDTATNGKGQVAGETFASGPNQAVSGSYTYSYDVRGRPVSTTFALTAPNTPVVNYNVSTSYDDADRPISLSLPPSGFMGSETLTFQYDDSAGGALVGLTSSGTSPTSTLFTNAQYNGQGLLSGWQTGNVTANGSTWWVFAGLTYDGDLRPASMTLTKAVSAEPVQYTTEASVAPSYDVAGNVSSVQTTLGAVGSTPGGSETQAFCYDEQNRLTWAGTAGSGPCTNPTSGSEGISGAGYTASYAYDTLDRITSASVLNGSGGQLSDAAQGPFGYGDSAHLHAVTSVGTGGGTAPPPPPPSSPSGNTSTGSTHGGTHPALGGGITAPPYSASYDAAGDMTCRSTSTTPALSCWNGNDGGQQMGYDALRRLIAWQNAPGASPTASEQYAYDGEGNRVWQQAQSVSVSTTTTTDTVYELGTDELTTTAITGQSATTTTVRTYPLPGGALAERDATGLYYLATDQLGTPIATLRLDDGTLVGTLVGTQLRTPYGQARYSSAAPTNGGMHSSFGFTGQREDNQAPGSSGLDYFNARYYDPLIGRFTSADDHVHADSLLDNYAYVGGRVEGTTDPSGNDWCLPDIDPRCILIILNLLNFLTNTANPPAWVSDVWSKLYNPANHPALRAPEPPPFGTQVGETFPNEGPGNADNGGGGPPKGSPKGPLDGLGGNNNGPPYYQKSVTSGQAERAKGNAQKGRQQAPGKEKATRDAATRFAVAKATAWETHQIGQASNAAPNPAQQLFSQAKPLIQQNPVLAIPLTVGVTLGVAVLFPLVITGNVAFNVTFNVAVNQAGDWLRSAVKIWANNIVVL